MALGYFVLRLSACYTARYASKYLPSSTNANPLLRCILLLYNALHVSCSRQASNSCKASSYLASAYAFTACCFSLNWVFILLRYCLIVELFDSYASFSSYYFPNSSSPLYICSLILLKRHSSVCSISYELLNSVAIARLFVSTRVRSFKFTNLLLL